MAKNRGKKNKEGKNVAKPSSKMKKENSKVKRKKSLVPGPTHAEPSEATTSDLNKGGELAMGVKKEKGRQKSFSGFIFMCNSKTKLECFQYRVFGLPMGQREVVEEIKPGAKLFLFDFESKLLYGVYVATSAGQVKLEPAAFGGKYPAQVRFKIFKECLPLPESSLRNIIKENYNGSKFKQELSGKLVKKLLSSFQPPLAPPRVIYQAPPNGSQAMLPPARENQFNHTVSYLQMPAPYLTEPRYVNIGPARPALQSAHILQQGNMGPVRPALQSAHILQQGYHRPASNVAPVPITVDHRNLSATGGYYVANSQTTYLTQGIAHEVQEPYRRAIEERPSYHQVADMGRQYHQLPRTQSGPVYIDSAAGYNSYRHTASTKYSSNLQVASSAPYPTARSVMHVQHPAAHGRHEGRLTHYSYDRPNR